VICIDRYLGWLPFGRRLPLRVAAGRILLRGLAGVGGMTVQRLLVRRFPAALAGNFALVDAVHRHATNIVD